MFMSRRTDRKGSLALMEVFVCTYLGYSTRKISAKGLKHNVYASAGNPDPEPFVSLGSETSRTGFEVQRSLRLDSF